MKKIKKTKILSFILVFAMIVTALFSVSVSALTESKFKDGKTWSDAIKSIAVKTDEDSAAQKMLLNDWTTTLNGKSLVSSGSTKDCVSFDDYRKQQMDFMAGFQKDMGWLNSTDYTVSNLVNGDIKSYVYYIKLITPAQKPAAPQTSASPAAASTQPAASAAQKAPVSTSASTSADNSKPVYKFVSEYKYDDSGTVYYGIMKDGKPDIFGALVNEKTGYFYMGGFKDGQFHTYYYDKDGALQSYGQAIFKQTDNNRWMADFKDGKIHGDGATIFTPQYKCCYNVKYRDGKCTDAGSTFDNLRCTDYTKIERYEDTSGNKYIKLSAVDLSSKSAVGVTYVSIYNAKIAPAIKITPDGNVYLYPTGINKTSDFGVYYNAKTGEWSYSWMSLAQLLSTGGVSGQTVSYINGQLLDYRYDENGSLRDPRMGDPKTRDELTGNSPSSSNSTPATTFNISSPTAPKKELCPHCNGTGRITCAVCHGSGLITTYHSGLYGQPGYWSNDYCKACGGLGYRTCPYCGGTGLK